MDTLRDTPLLKFNPTTLQDVRKELNLHQEGALDQMINNFEDWIAKQNHFTRTRFDRRYLETSIVLGKGSLERSKNTLDKLCTLKTLLPDLFSKHDAKNELFDTSPFVIQAIMPRLLEDNYRVYIVKMISSDFDPSNMLDFQRFTILMSEYMKNNDYSIGCSCIIDCRDVNIMHLITKINIVELHNFMSVLMEGYCMRIKGIHILSSSKAIDMFVSLLKQVVSKKIGDRIIVHKTTDTIHDFITKDVLPEEYGGSEKSLKEIHETWKDVLSEKENVEFLRDISKAGTNEKNRLADKFNHQILGMPGSFRALTVD